MRRRVALALSAVLLGGSAITGLTAAADPLPPPGGSAAYVVVGPQTFADRDSIAKTGAAIDEIDDGKIYVTATPAEADAIRQLGFSLETQLQPTTGGSATPQDFPTSDSKYHTYGEMVAEINAVAAARPDLVRTSVIGKSQQGRDLLAIKISDNVAIDENEPEILFDAHLHAREHLTVEMALYLLNTFTGQYASDARIRNTVNSREIWILPDLNPDGGEFDIASGQYQFWRKNRQPNAGTTAIGTDLNRNFGFQWNCCGGSSGDPASETYRGPSPFSAPETVAFRDFVLGRRVGGIQQIKASIDFHAYSELVLWPSGYTRATTTPQLTADQAATLRAIGTEMAGTNGYTPKQSSELYIADGNIIDWMWSTQGVWSYTFEMFPGSNGAGGFYPGDEAIPAETARNKDAVLKLSEYADCPYRAIGKEAQYCTPLSIAQVPNFSTKVGVAKNAQLSATGGVQPYRWAVTGLPTGMTFDSSTGVMYGTPTVVGDFLVSYTLTDASGVTATRWFTWSVTLAETRTFNGSATASKPTTAVSLARNRANGAATAAGFAVVNCEEIAETIEPNAANSWDASVTLSCTR